MAQRFLVVTAAEAEALQLAYTFARQVGPAASINWAGTLAQAVSNLQACPADLLIVDCALPDSAGLATFDALHAAAPGTPILTLHEAGNDALAASAVQHGADGKLLKGNYQHDLLPLAIDAILAHSAVAQRCERQRGRAEITLDAIGDAVVSTGRDGCIDYLNEAAANISGWSVVDALGRPVGQVLQLMNKATREPVRNPLELVLEQNCPIRLPPGTVLVRRDGSQAAIEDAATPIRDRHGKLAGAVIVFHDVSEARDMVEQMAHLATHDFLTKLPNRAMLLDRIDQAIARGQRDGSAFALLYLDLDNFKLVNDTLGHPTGDQLLCSVANRLRQCVRSSDTVSRQGGDEFIVLMPDQHSPDDVAITADKILAALVHPHCIGEHALQISASVGVCLYPNDGQDAVTLIKNADTAMYMAKDKGRNNRQFFEHGMNARWDVSASKNR